jgi:hypothetical protein
MWLSKEWREINPYEEKVKGMSLLFNCLPAREVSVKNEAIGLTDTKKTIEQP